MTLITKDCFLFPTYQIMFIVTLRDWFQCFRITVDVLCELLLGLCIFLNLGIPSRSKLI